MTTLIDLTRPLETLEKEKFPSMLMPLYRIISPEVDFIDHARGAKIMQEIFSCPSSDLPDREGWAEENLSISSHLGTHVDAPWHYGSTCNGAPAKTVDQIPLSELFCDAVVLDFSHLKGTGIGITVKDLEEALAKIPYKIKPGDAALIRTDHDKFALTDPMRYFYPGLTHDSAMWLADQGIKVGGTDATGWDRPFPVMVNDYKTSGDKKHIWDAHFAYRNAEVYVVQQLVNLDKLPLCGFKAAFFPLKLVGASAAPCRAVGFVE
jgi:kynurenine formamidase